MRILVEPKNALTKQYRRLLELDNAWSWKFSPPLWKRNCSAGH